MKLRSKLLLGVGFLLFAMVIVMYIVPTIFVHRDIHNAAEEIHELLIEEHGRLVKSQKIWIEDVVQSIKQNTNSILFMLYEEPDLSSALSFDSSSKTTVWDALSKMIGYDPSVGFIQAHSPKENKTAVITPHKAPLYTVDKFTDEKSLALISLKDEKQNTADLPFIGLALPEEFQTEKGYTLYALVNPQKATEQLSEIHEEIAKLTPELVKKKLEESKELQTLPGLEEKPAFYWAIKVNLIRILTPLFVQGLAVKKDEKMLVPEGIARLDTTGNGYAVLTQDVYQTTPLFDDQLYYEQHQPLSSGPPLADGTVIVVQNEGGHVYIGNTLLLGSTYLSLGNHLGSVIQQLALSSNKLILVRVKKDFWMGFDGQGQRLSAQTIQSILASGFLDQKKGMVSLNDEIYFYGQISSLENGNLDFYDFRPAGGQKTIFETLMTLEDRLSERISWQLSLISFVTMILVLLFIARIGFGVIHPISKLAAATQDVVKGRYEDVSLPDVGKRKDEVATLTHSFGDMVKGLQDREKIRGVLDKVVSKEVADEILRTQIHLGGEDRVISILFSDIREFTKLSENAPPQKIIQMLNGCMTKISRVIEGEGGVIDKYVGDEVMAIFGAPTTHADHALRAVSSGMLIIETLKKWNQERVDAGEPSVQMGIGVHTGLVVAGNMGAEDRLNYTVLGASVNLASRLCEVAQPNQLLISEATLSEPNIEASFYTNALPPILLKGFSEPIRVYEVTGFKWEES